MLRALPPKWVLHARLLLWRQRWQLRRVQINLRDGHVAPTIRVLVAGVALVRRPQGEPSLVVESLPDT